MKENVGIIRNIYMSDYAQKTDIELVKFSLEQADHFLYLMNRYEKQLLYYIRRISGLNLQDAEDLLQEVFVKTYYNLNGFDPKLKFSSWIYRIAHNQVVSEIRKIKARPLYYYEEQDLINIVNSLEVDNSVDKNILKDEIQGFLANLDKKYREVLVLKYLEEKDYKEISDILKKPIGTVGTLMNRAKKKLKEEILKNKMYEHK